MEEKKEDKTMELSTEDKSWLGSIFLCLLFDSHILLYVISVKKKKLRLLLVCKIIQKLLR